MEISLDNTFLESANSFYWEEDDDKYILSIDLPGYSDINVQAKNGNLYITAKRGKYTFDQFISIPNKVDISTISAVFVDSIDTGVLSISIGKKEETLSITVPVQ